jgi:hypothetical protein
LSKPKQSRGKSFKLEEICRGVEPPVLELRTFVLYAENISTVLLMIASRALSRDELNALSTAREERYVMIAT